jgi:pimeloyl-ACP methyl ester carboxylesterase
MPTTEIDDARIAYHEVGHGEPVIVLHASASTSGQWRRLGERLQDRYRVVAPDLHGYGDSDVWSGRGPLALADEARLVTRLMDRFSAPVHLVGHCYGGAVALEAALENRHRLRSLTLIEPTAFHLLRSRGARERSLYAEIGGIASTVNEAAVSGDYWGGMARFVDYWCGAGSWEELPAGKRRTLAGCTAKVLSDFWATMTERTPLEAYRGISAPTLVLYGDESPRTARRVAELVSQTIPDAELAMIAGAGHMLPLTHGALVNDLIRGHLETSATEITTAFAAPPPPPPPAAELDFEAIGGRQF